MNNFIDYFYNIKVNEIVNNGKFYSFVYNKFIYQVFPINNNIIINISNLVDINKKLLGYTLVSEIIVNKDNSYISYFNKQGYILLKIFANINKKITLSEITYLADNLHTKKDNNNWGILWERKIDYLEKLIKENGKKYPLIVDSFNYFVGMAENAICYYNDILIPRDYEYVVSHRNIRFNDKVDALYNPLNIIFDYKSRDLAEYIKNSFFINNKQIFDELYQSMMKNNLSIIDIKLIVSRILYPSFYFEMYEDIMVYGNNERIIVDIVDRLPEYETYLANIITFFRKWYDIPEINWLKKNKSED